MKIKLTKEQGKELYYKLDGSMHFQEQTIEISEDQVVEELSNYNKWSKIFCELEFLENKKVKMLGYKIFFMPSAALAGAMDSLGYDATKAYNKIVKGGEG